MKWGKQQIMYLTTLSEWIKEQGQRGMIKGQKLEKQKQEVAESHVHLYIKRTLVHEISVIMQHLK